MKRLNLLPTSWPDTIRPRRTIGAAQLSLEDAVDQKARASKDFIEATESYRICLRARIKAIGEELAVLTASINADREKAKKSREWLDGKKADLQLVEQETDVLRGLDRLTQLRLGFSQKRESWMDRGRSHDPGEF